VGSSNYRATEASKYSKVAGNPSLSVVWPLQKVKRMAKSTTGEKGNNTHGNGLDGAGDGGARPEDIIAAATSLPNLDGRESVLTEIPKDLFVANREKFAVDEAAPSSGIGPADWGKPSDQDWVNACPDPTLYAILWCIKDKRNRGKVIPVTEGLLTKYSSLKKMARPYIIRPSYVLGARALMWHAPAVGAENPAPSDADARQAQLEARNGWTRTWWDYDDQTFKWCHPGDIEAFHKTFGPPPEWAKETLEEFNLRLFQTIKNILIWSPTQRVVQRLAGIGALPSSPSPSP
jgi:hypothetical protein